MYGAFKSLFFKVFFYITLFLLTYSFCVKFNVLDYDLWARLIQGWHVVVHHSVMYQDIVSYTNTHVWYDPEWLSSAFIYMIAHKFHGAGLTLLKVFLLYAFFISIIISLKSLIKSKESPYNTAYFVFLLALLVQSSIATYTVRCQLITFIFFAVWIYLLELVRKGHDTILYFLPFIMLLWLNLHGGCIAGVGILVLYAIGEFLNKKPFKKYLITLFFVGLVFFINPWGIQYVKFMFESSYLDRSWIAEWQSPL